MKLLKNKGIFSIRLLRTLFCSALLLGVSVGASAGFWGWVGSWFKDDEEKKEFAEKIKSAEPGESIEWKGQKVPSPQFPDYSDEDKRRQVIETLPEHSREHLNEFCGDFPKDCGAATAFAEARARREKDSGGRWWHNGGLLDFVRRDPKALNRVAHRIALESQFSDPKALQRLMEIYGQGRGRNHHAEQEEAFYGILNRPEDPSSYLNFTKASRAAGQPKDAIEAAKAGLEVDPGNAQLYSALGQANYDYGDYGAAFEAGMAALELNPKDLNALSVVKFTKGRQGPREGGAAALLGGAPQAVQEPMPDAGVSAAGLGALGPAASYGGIPRGQISSEAFNASDNLAKNAQTAVAQKDYASAIRSATRAVEINPKNAKALYWRSAAYLHGGRYREALSDIDSALALAPANYTLLVARAGILNKMGSYKDALGAANAALQVRPTSGPAQFQAAFAMAGLGNREGSLAALRQAALLDAAQFGNAYQAALQLPEDGDLLGIFNGSAEAVRGGSLPDEGKRGVDWTFWIAVLAGAGLLSVGGFMVRGRRREEDFEAAPEPVVVESPRGPPSNGDFSQAAAPVDTIGGTFRLVKQIGAGGMGVVHEAIDTSLERRVAVKKMRDEIRSDARERERFVSEAKTVAKLKHPNIVEIYRIVEDNLDVYLVFEFVNGKTISNLIHERKRFSLDQALPIVSAVAEALDYAHLRGIIHRDLKPSNVMIDEAGSVKVMDFGVARAAKDSVYRMSMTNTVVGTPPYMAPEQEQGMVRKESDVYALAVCLYEMLAGKLPFAGVGAGMLMAKMNKTFTPLSRVVEGLPSGLDSVMDRAFDPDPDKRWSTAAEFIQNLSTLSTPR